MARAPTWAELRLDATKLAQLQNECYRSVHYMLDHSIPELDRKLSRLKQENVCRSKDHPLDRLKPDLDELEHLKPPPLPLSHYLKMNRPNVIEAANSRVAYLRKSAERRKLNASAKTINALDQIRAASRTSSNRGSLSLRSSLRGGMTRSSTGPNLTQIKCKLSEQEMKQLTARTYNRLAEVKKQRIQEVTKHLKVQNYKNKIEYGRRLLENRRRGIINYPLKGHHDGSSVMSSLEESLTDSFGERSADGIKFDQYY